MRQHVNPLSKNFEEIKPIPPLNEIFENPYLPLHVDIGCGSGNFLLELALTNKNWNYFGIEIREKLIENTVSRIKNKSINNLFFSFGNANNILDNHKYKFLIESTSSISFNFPDPWFKKKHHKRRVIQSSLMNCLANTLQKESLLFIKTDVEELFNYMDKKILENINFKKLNSNHFALSKSFNPTKIQTSRENYVILNQLNIYEKIYIKI